MNLTRFATNPTYADLTAEAVGAWVKLHAHATTRGLQTLTQATIINHGQLTTMSTYSELEDAGLITPNPDGTYTLHTPKD